MGLIIGYTTGMKIKIGDDIVITFLGRLKKDNGTSPGPKIKIDAPKNVKINKVLEQFDKITKDET